jgi:hypothetical protein
MVISAAAFFYFIFDWENIFEKIHIFIATVFASSGFLICYSTDVNMVSMAQYVYYVAGTISWYGVLYCYISSKTSLKIHHYVQSEIVIAFLTFAGTLLTFSEVPGLKSKLITFKYNSPGIIFLILYLWINEIFYKNSNDLFVENVMIGLNPQLPLFADHRVSYSLILVSCHYCNIIFLLIFIGDTTETNDDSTISDIDVSDIDILKEKLDRRRNQIKKSEALTMNMNNIEKVTNNGDMRRNMNTEYENIIQSQSEFPGDCIEISQEDAVLLTGNDYSMVDSFNHSDKHHVGV